MLLLAHFSPATRQIAAGTWPRPPRPTSPAGTLLPHPLAPGPQGYPHAIGCQPNRFAVLVQGCRCFVFGVHASVDVQNFVRCFANRLVHYGSQGADGRRRYLCGRWSGRLGEDAAHRNVVVCVKRETIRVDMLLKPPTVLSFGHQCLISRGHLFDLEPDGDGECSGTVEAIMCEQLDLVARVGPT